MSAPQDTIYYKRSRFSTRLPSDRLYTASHHWLAEESPGLWRIGFTKFATRMLGDIVEFGFEVKPHDHVEIGQAIGWVEGFKAVSDLYCVMEGAFAGGNRELEADITLVDTDPYGRGWIYSVRGKPDPVSVDTRGYIDILDLTIDRMQKKESD